jgi:hypothetical protein
MILFVGLFAWRCFGLSLAVCIKENKKDINKKK